MRIGESGMKTKNMCIPAIVTAIVLFVGSLISVASVTAADSPPAEGSVLPEFTLPAPGSQEESGYLGIQGQSAFKVPQVKAEVVILEIFSMYCPYCQKEAPRVNELYALIKARNDLKDKIKLIGIGAGNTPFEVSLFKTKYNVPFPLLPDADFRLHKILGQTRTPYFIAVRINRDDSSKVIYSKLGGIGEPAELIDLLTRRAGLKKGE
jgi:peroxiredoxin